MNMVFDKYSSSLLMKHPNPIHNSYKLKILILKIIYYLEVKQIKGPTSYGI